MIRDDVRITVLGVKGNWMHIGIDAPKHVAVHREEIFERVKAQRVEIPNSRSDKAAFSSVATHR